jgi:uncharacterized protein YecE (DUF72 family)
MFASGKIRLVRFRSRRLPGEKRIEKPRRGRYACREAKNMATKKRSAATHVGPAGWSYADWIGPVYPPGRRTDGLATIARYFDCVELNSSFYRTPAPRLVRSWAERIADTDGFTFTVKVLQRFTHERAGTFDEARRFIHTFDPLIARGAVGGFLLQFPWSFRDSPENRGLIAVLGRWFAEYPTAVELRHGSWNAPPTETFIAGCGLAFCNIDQPAVGPSMPPTEIVTDRRLGYIRLHGRNRADWARPGAGRDERYNYLYRGEDLEEWKLRAERIAAKSDELYIITNNHFRAQALVNAFQLKHLLTGEKQRMPDTLVASYPMLRSIAIERPGQGDLF